MQIKKKNKQDIGESQHGMQAVRNESACVTSESHNHSETSEEERS